MKKQLISLEKQSIYSRIKKFFYKIFHRVPVDEIDVDKKEIINNDIKKENFIKDIKENVDMSEITKRIKIEEFVKELEVDDTILDNLSLDRLKILEKFYEDRVNRKKELLKKIKNNN